MFVGKHDGAQPHPIRNTWKEGKQTRERVVRRVREFEEDVHEATVHFFLGWPWGGWGLTWGTSSRPVPFLQKEPIPLVIPPVWWGGAMTG